MFTHTVIYHNINQGWGWYGILYDDKFVYSLTQLVSQVCLPSTWWKYINEYCECSNCCSSLLHSGCSSIKIDWFLFLSPVTFSDSLFCTELMTNSNHIDCTTLMQVLHLMNKMNIPAPFRMALPTPPLPPEVPAPLPPTVTINPQSADLSSGESEMESSDEVTPSLLSVLRITFIIAYIGSLNIYVPFLFSSRLKSNVFF